MADHESTSRSKQLVEAVFFRLAKLHIAIHRPTKVVVVGSVGKTSTKMALAKLLETEKRVSYMDDSYNDGIGLYLSVFELKVPNRTTPVRWFGLLLKAIWHMISHHDEILVLEYGISKPGDMDAMLRLARPDVTVLTAVTPEHMEYLKTIDIVGAEETKAVRAAREFAVVNAEDVDEKYLQDIATPLLRYGDDATRQAYFSIRSFASDGVRVDFSIDGVALEAVHVQIVSEPLIRQATGALLAAKKLGISSDGLRHGIEQVSPVPGRMRLFRGLHGTTILDDTANFSPIAGVVALNTLKKLPAKRRIAILGNMHELGDYIEPGYREVGEAFSGIDVLVLVGELSKTHFGAIARQQGYKESKTLFLFDTSPEAGAYVRDTLLQAGDVVVVKGPFGGFYLEEATKKLLAYPDESKLLTRQSDFWLHKKRTQFGDLLDV